MALFRGAGGSGTSTAFGLLDEVTQQALLAQNASALATQAINSFDSFDDRYLGSKTSDPTLDNDGNTLLMCAIICGMRELAIKILSKINIHNLNFQNKYF